MTRLLTLGLLILSACARSTSAPAPSSDDYVFALAAVEACDAAGAVRWQTYEGDDVCTAKPFISAEHVRSAALDADEGAVAGFVSFTHAGVMAMRANTVADQWAMLLDSKVAGTFYVRATFENGGFGAPIKYEMDSADAQRIARRFGERFPRPAPADERFAIVGVFRTSAFPEMRSMQGPDGAEHQVTDPIVDTNDLRAIDARATATGLVLSATLDDLGAERLRSEFRRHGLGMFGLIVDSRLVKIAPISSAIDDLDEWIGSVAIPMSRADAQRAADVLNAAVAGD